MKRQFHFLLFSIFLLSSVPAKAVYFADTNLEAAVESALGISDPTTIDMLELERLTCTHSDIKDLWGLEYAKNLKELYLYHNLIGDLLPLAGLNCLTHLDLNHNQISDLSDLGALVNLQYLNLHGNQISDLSDLAGLHNLKWINIHKNQISDLSGLDNLTQLEHLDLYQNNISDIYHLSELSSLESLVLSDNQIRDITALAGLNKLQQLLITFNQISDISVLSHLNNIQCLTLSSNQISDLSPLLEVMSLKQLGIQYNPLNEESCEVIIPQIIINNPGISVTHDCMPESNVTLVLSSTRGGVVSLPGEGQFIYEKGKRVLLKAQPDPGYVFIGWSGTYNSTRNNIYITMDHDYHMTAHFASVLGTIYIDDDADTDPGPSNAAVSDPHENGTWEHPFDSIQEALDVSAEGATVYVHSGVYLETIEFPGKNIQLIGNDPNDLVPAYAIIDGNGTGPVVSFKQGEDWRCKLKGFILTYGAGERAGAIYCQGSSPTIENCLLVGNRTTGPDSGVVYCRDSNAVFINCTISGNRATGMYVQDGDVQITNSILWDNVPQAFQIAGDGHALVRYSDIAGGLADILQAESGGGNLDTDPLFAGSGYWFDTNDLHAVWVEGDYHLRSRGGRWDGFSEEWIVDDVSSPCIDAGDPNGGVYDEPVPHGDIINMGAYGGSRQASKSYQEPEP